MTKKRLKKVYKPMAYLFIGCFLIYILLSQAMSVFSRTAEIDKLEKEVAIVASIIFDEIMEGTD